MNIGNRCTAVRTGLTVLSAATTLAAGLASAAPTASAPISGPLAQSADNPRYFADAEGDIVYLTGSHTWNTLVDMDDEYPPEPFDFPAWLDFLTAHNHNFIRLYTWEVPNPGSTRYERRIFAAPLPWARTGPGVDSMGRAKFDLFKRNPEYFSRLRRRVAMAAEAGIYVSVMLFEGWAVQFAPGRESHPFLLANNVNGIDAEDPERIHTLDNPEILAVQEAHIRNVVDTVNDFDNVLYEIINESGSYSTAWQYHMIRYLRDYEAGKPRQHPIGMTYQHRGGLNETLLASDADWISPGSESGRYFDDPRPNDGEKVILTDTDHLGGSAFGDRKWVWKSFTRGLNPIFMDRYELPDSVTDKGYEHAREVRTAMGLTRLLAQRMGLLSMQPRPDIASSGFALAGPERLIVYQPEMRSEYVDLRGMEGSFNTEWLNPRTGEVVQGDRIEGGQEVRLVRPAFDDDVVLCLYRSEHEPTMGVAEFEQRAREIVNAGWSASDSRRVPGFRVRSLLPDGWAEYDLKPAVILFVSGIVAGLAIALTGVSFRKRRNR